MTLRVQTLPSPPPPRSLFWLLQLGGWALFGAGMFAAGVSHWPVLYAAVVKTSLTVFGFAASLLLRAAYRELARRGAPLPATVAAAIPLSYGAAGLWMAPHNLVVASYLASARAGGIRLATEGFPDFSNTIYLLRAPVLERALLRHRGLPGPRRRARAGAARGGPGPCGAARGSAPPAQPALPLQRPERDLDAHRREPAVGGQSDALPPRRLPSFDARENRHRRSAAVRRDRLRLPVPRDRGDPLRREAEGGHRGRSLGGVRPRAAADPAAAGGERGAPLGAAALGRGRDRDRRRPRRGLAHARRPRRGSRRGLAPRAAHRHRPRQHPPAARGALRVAGRADARCERPRRLGGLDSPAYRLAPEAA